MFVIILVEGIARLLLGKMSRQSLPVRSYRKFNAASFKVFRCSFSQTIPMFNRLKVASYSKLAVRSLSTSMARALKSARRPRKNKTNTASQFRDISPKKLY